MFSKQMQKIREEKAKKFKQDQVILISLEANHTLSAIKKLLSCAKDSLNKNKFPEPGTDIYADIYIDSIYQKYFLAVNEFDPVLKKLLNDVNYLLKSYADTCNLDNPAEKKIIKHLLSYTDKPNTFSKKNLILLLNDLNLLNEKINYVLEHVCDRGEKRLNCDQSILVYVKFINRYLNEIFDISDETEKEETQDENDHHVALEVERVSKKTIPTISTCGEMIITTTSALLNKLKQPEVCKVNDTEFFINPLRIPEICCIITGYLDLCDLVTLSQVDYFWHTVTKMVIPKIALDQLKQLPEPLIQAILKNLNLQQLSTLSEHLAMDTDQRKQFVQSKIDADKPLFKMAPKTDEYISDNAIITLSLDLLPIKKVIQLNDLFTTGPDFLIAIIEGWYTSSDIAHLGSSYDTLICLFGSEDRLSAAPVRKAIKDGLFTGLQLSGVYYPPNNCDFLTLLSNQNVLNALREKLLTFDQVETLACKGGDIKLLILVGPCYNLLKTGNINLERIERLHFWELDPLYSLMPSYPLILEEQEEALRLAFLNLISDEVFNNSFHFPLLSSSPFFSCGDRSKNNKNLDRTHRGGPGGPGM